MILNKLSLWNRFIKCSRTQWFVIFPFLIVFIYFKSNNDFNTVLITSSFIPLILIWVMTEIKYHIYEIEYFQETKNIKLVFKQYSDEHSQEIDIKDLTIKIGTAYYVGTNANNLNRMVVKCHNFKIVQYTNQVWTTEKMYEFKWEIDKKQTELGFLTPLQIAKNEREKKRIMEDLEKNRDLKTLS